MGILGFRELTNKYPGRTGRLEDIHDKIIAIDANNMMIIIFSAVHKSHVNVSGEVDEEGLIQHWLNTIIKQLKLLRGKDNQVIVIFDGKYSHLKKNTQNKRIDDKNKSIMQRDQLLEKFEEESYLMTSEEIDKLQKLNSRNFSFKREYLDYLKDALNRNNFTYYHANGEAEKECAHLSKENIVDYVYTRDTDALVHGAKFIITKIEGKTGTFDCMILDDILERIELNYNQFIEVCIMIGCDYNERAKNLGPKTALKLMKKYGSFQKIKENEKKYDYDKLNFDECYKIFTTEISPPVQEKEIKVDNKDFEDLLALLKDAGED